jgi:hypothetical protein
VVQVNTSSADRGSGQVGHLAGVATARASASVFPAGKVQVVEQVSPAWIRMKAVERRVDLDVIEPVTALHGKKQLERFILVA